MAEVNGPLPEHVADALRGVPTHTNEARMLVANGTVKPGDPVLDVPIDTMTDREILCEMLIHARNTRDAVTKFVDGVNNSPVGRMIAGGGNPLGGMFSAGNSGT